MFHITIIAASRQVRCRRRNCCTTIPFVLGGVVGEDESDSDDEDANASAMDLKGLAETDPEFYSFLQVRFVLVPRRLFFSRNGGGGGENEPQTGSFSIQSCAHFLYLEDKNTDVVDALSTGRNDR